MRTKPVRALLFTVFSFLGLVMFVFYLWGKIQIDFAVRNNADLERQCRSLQHDIDDLRVEINTLKSYQRVTDAAQNQGFVFVGPDQTGELPVDLSGLKAIGSERTQKTVLARGGHGEGRLLTAALEGNHGTR
jgi:hypothetical protein